MFASSLYWILISIRKRLCFDTLSFQIVFHVQFDTASSESDFIFFVDANSNWEQILPQIEYKKNVIFYLTSVLLTSSI